jgi:hypothetical protein
MRQETLDNHRERQHLSDFGIDGRIILNFILEEQVVRR